jgi:hypothetical protein
MHFTVTCTTLGTDVDANGVSECWAGRPRSLHGGPVASDLTMAKKQPPTPDLNDDEQDVIRESSRGGQEPPPEVNDTPGQNAGYDEAVKGAPLTAEERRRAERESPLDDKNDRLTGRD